ncbi:ATP phosphoribosyltransferase regulatory subunit [Hydrogenibacillus sp. N12]|uniref:ATP phosphoribosyltransferase regulatory subunit n=1 Tax=Hydrogenibacillus sp. N12 TaxID=2866627 RepID=UPI001C7D4D5C|nr:ATP phosphoribosyltransferase regulatory subunit [Hydrogenibacillus sp. N12]QZA32783.1 ATP phosphoribosyltransferase regulatory subunit [Hydrogenibacillus sp. N12]
MDGAYAFEKPLGFHDRPPALMARMEALTARWLELFARYGYRRVSTPALEFQATIGRYARVAPAKMFPLFDAEGRLVVLRPDMTTPIARLAASTLRSTPLPLRLSYAEPVFRLPQAGEEGQAERWQVGVELIGVGPGAGDLEALVVAAEALIAAGVPEPAFVVGDAALVPLVFAALRLKEAERSALETALLRRDFAAFSSVAGRIGGDVGAALAALIGPLQPERADALGRSLRALTRASGDAAAVDAARAVEERLSALLDLLADAASLFPDVRWLADPAFVPDLEYYTGIVFEGYGRGAGAPLVRGGRYDHLLGRFGREAPATGFALDLERTLAIVEVPLPSRPRTAIRIQKGNRRQAFEEARRRVAAGETVELVEEREDRVGDAGGASGATGEGGAGHRAGGARTGEGGAGDGR